jgi:hypothetical protein
VIATLTTLMPTTPTTTTPTTTTITIIGHVHVHPLVVTVLKHPTLFIFLGTLGSISHRMSNSCTAAFVMRKLHLFLLRT